ncbi:hypothetical protein Pla52n_37340 [Stieleria varia]|uniref:Uncharacterized protein n=1 Tax=Stieleria varia TaxID=2528005 RepID=A0A5C6AUE2_9BACT|nr:hypothetical protein Pla52n_37340 [Stieleria varia]
MSPLPSQPAGRGDSARRSTTSRRRHRRNQTDCTANSDAASAYAVGYGSNGIGGRMVHVWPSGGVRFRLGKSNDNSRNQTDCTANSDAASAYAFGYGSNGFGGRMVRVWPSGGVRFRLSKSIACPAKRFAMLKRFLVQTPPPGSCFARSDLPQLRRLLI